MYLCLPTLNTSPKDDIYRAPVNDYFLINMLEEERPEHLNSYMSYVWTDIEQL